MLQCFNLQGGSPCHLGLPNFQFLVASRLLKANAHHVPNFINISQMVAELSHLRYSKRWSTHVLNFLNFNFWTDGKLWRSNICHHPKFRQNWKNRFWYIAIFRLSRWPTFVILYFKLLVARQVGMGNMHRHTKYYQNRSTAAEILHFKFLQNGCRPPSWIF